MSSLIIEIPQPNTRFLLFRFRAELDTCLANGLNVIEQDRRVFYDDDEARERLHHLAEDGDESWAKQKLRKLIDFDCPGSGRVWDAIKDHISLISSAYWRLHQAEKAARSKLLSN